MAYKARKRKVKKNVPEGQAHIHVTYNNTIITITDMDGNVISWATAGSLGYKGSKKSTPFVAQLVATKAAEGAKFSATMNEFVETIHNLGPNKKLEDLRCKK